jgi:peptide deformylase
MILTIREYPDPILRHPARPVETMDETLQSFMADMLETMYAARGIGLAAPQVGQGLRVICVDVSEERNQGQVLINPRILRKEGNLEGEEGCLSVPGLYETVRRAAWIEVEALNGRGEPFTAEAEGLLAVCIQHEMDHLEGVLFIDRLPELRRQRLKKQLGAARSTHASEENSKVSSRVRGKRAPIMQQSLLVTQGQGR